MSLISLLAQDRSVILYRKELNQITGSVTASILLSQFIYWHAKNKGKAFYKFAKPCTHPMYREGDSWEEELGFTTSELRGAMCKLKDAGFIESRTDNQRVTYYSLGVDKLNLALKEVYPQQVVEKFSSSSCEIHNNSLLKPDLHIYTENTSKTTTDISCAKAPVSLKQNDTASQFAKEVISYLNEKTGSRFQNARSTIALIEARAREGASLEDFKAVIDSKAAEWSADSKMKKFLRPITLFQASKFNDYLGQAHQPAEVGNQQQENIEGDVRDFWGDY